MLSEFWKPEVKVLSGWFLLEALSENLSLPLSWFLVATGCLLASRSYCRQHCDLCLHLHVVFSSLTGDTCHCSKDPPYYRMI